MPPRFGRGDGEEEGHWLRNLMRNPMNGNLQFTPRVLSGNGSVFRRCKTVIEHRIGPDPIRRESAEWRMWRREGGGIYPPLFLGNKKLNAWRINIATWPILKWQHEYNKFIEFIFVFRLGFFRFVLIKFRQSLRKKNSVALFDEHGEYLISCNLDNSILSFREECSNHGPTIRITLDSVETLVSKSSRYECAAIMLHNWIFLYGTCKRRD